MALRNSIAHTHGVYNKDERPRGKSLGQKDLCVKTYSATQTFEKYEVLKYYAQCAWKFNFSAHG